ncbi:hypothetical protein CVS40_4414 [Lucilia cuprina]|nr:hypothetical protein CVS40_4414 [Lucilia cuprina]
MASPACNHAKRVSKSSNSSSSHVSMTTSTADENFIETKLFSWMRLKPKTRRGNEEMKNTKL